jgi:hypothetical protein
VVTTDEVGVATLKVPGGYALTGLGAVSQHGDPVTGTLEEKALW